MLRKGNDLNGYHLIAKNNGMIGSTKEFYFEDDTWTVRYIVVETGSWLLEHPVLISPASIREINTAAKAINVHLTREQIEHSPPVDTDKPISRRYEDQYYRYYGINPYWVGPERWGIGQFPSVFAGPALTASGMPELEPGDPHLRSSEELLKYTVHAEDGDAGVVDDFIFDDESWAIRYVVVNTASWWPGGTVLLSPLWITRISWDWTRISVDLSRRVIKEAPRYDPALPITADYEKRLFRYYGSEEYLNLLHLKHLEKV